jgi:hypothetical protein
VLTYELASYVCTVRGACPSSNRRTGEEVRTLYEERTEEGNEWQDFKTCFYLLRTVLEDTRLLRRGKKRHMEDGRHLLFFGVLVHMVPGLKYLLKTTKEGKKVISIVLLFRKNRRAAIIYCNYKQNVLSLFVWTLPGTLAEIIFRVPVEVIRSFIISFWLSSLKLQG